MLEKKGKLLFIFIITLVVSFFLFFLNKTNKSEITKFYGSGEKEIEYVGDDEKGVVLHYLKNGNLSKKIELKNRLIDGKYLTYYESGELLDSAMYSKGNIKSSLFSFNKNGHIKSKLNFNEKNEKNGMSYFYNKNGQLQTKKNFIKNHLYYRGIIFSK